MLTETGTKRVGIGSVSGNPGIQVSRRGAFLLLVVAVTLAYIGSIHGDFHFDDWHGIVENPAIRKIDVRFFRDASAISILPDHQMYRPLLVLSLSIDYAIGKGSVVVFHVQTLLWFLLLIWLAWKCWEPLGWVGLLAAALFALHPACAETVNYISQRAEIMAAVGVMGSFYLCLRGGTLPRWAFTIPMCLGALCKPTALAFAPILVAWILIHRRTDRRRIGWVAVAAAQSAITVWIMTPAAAKPVASFWPYVITQPYVSLRYLRSFFLPFWLTADSDLVALPWNDPRVLTGFLGVGFLVVAVVWLARRPATRDMAFGLAWFLLALIPTALVPLSEVENDHRMFLPFIGLALSVACACSIVCDRLAMPTRQRWATAAVVLLALGIGVHARNQVWRTDESLWHDVTLKSPENGRGLMNYGVCLMRRGQLDTARKYFEMATVFSPNYSYLETNLGVVYRALGDQAAAAQHFQKARILDPRNAALARFW